MLILDTLGIERGGGGGGSGFKWPEPEQLCGDFSLIYIHVCNS